jgi:hypothetical protein
LSWFTPARRSRAPASPRAQNTSSPRGTWSGASVAQRRHCRSLIYVCHSNADVFEVYSRTQGPQHWHIARRERAGAVFMEVMRKETSLTDVDNELLGVLRRYRDDA